MLVILGVEEHGFQAERLTFEATILDVVVRRCVIHEILNRSLRLVAVKNRLGSGPWRWGLHVR